MPETSSGAEKTAEGCQDKTYGYKMNWLFLCGVCNGQFRAPNMDMPQIVGPEIIITKY